jgi:hypothetical protein
MHLSGLREGMIVYFSRVALFLVFIERVIINKSIISHLLIFLLVLVITAGATGCIGGTSVCSNSSLKAAILAAPQNWSVTNDLTPAFTWIYPDSTCHPEFYRVDLTTVEGTPGNWTGTTSSPIPAWSPASPLEPGKEYEWTVWSLNSNYVGPQSLNHFLFTGPMCDTDSLKAPALIRPDDGEVVTNLTPMLMWEYPDPCLAESYRIALSTDTQFADTSRNGATGNPSTNWRPGSSLADCTTYFWRVAPINGTSLGPYSGVKFFRTDREQECYTPEATGTVQGFLWYDQCSLPLDTSPVPSPLPAGCVVDSYGVDADRLHQPGEPFMTGITVNIGPGDCPSSGTQSTVTDANGAYTFSGLTPGKYCINVNAASWLGPGGTGHWTLISSGHEGNTYRAITLGAGQVLTSQGFAWYQYAGPTPTPTITLIPTSTPTPVPLTFTPNINAYCRFGPNRLFDYKDLAMKGQAYLLDGRNNDGTWYRIMLTPFEGCWVPFDVGTPSSDVSRLRELFDIPTLVPTDTPTEVVNCSSYTDEKSCEAQPVCVWKIPPTGALGACVNK